MPRQIKVPNADNKHYVNLQKPSPVLIGRDCSFTWPEWRVTTALAFAVRHRIPEPLWPIP